MTIKKVYEPLVALLKENEGKKVSTLMPQILAIVQSKQQSTTYRKDDNGVITHVFCYYHKKWEDVQVAEYSAKKTASGLNTMCKEGTNQWSKQQRDFKKGKEDILTCVINETLASSEIEVEMLRLENERHAIIDRKDGHGEES